MENSTLARHLSLVILAGAIALGSPRLANAQAMRTSAEVLGFTGGVRPDGGLTVGGGLQVFAPAWGLAVEAAHLTLTSGFSGPDATVRDRALSVDANVHYLLPSRSNSLLRPYALAGLGVMRYTVSGTVGTFDGSVSTTDVGLNLGGGLRVRAGDRWGFRPEVKVLLTEYRSTRFSVGAYYRLGR